MAEAIRGGDADAVARRAATRAGDDVRWIDADAARSRRDGGRARRARRARSPPRGAVIAAARAGDAATALEALGAFRLLCAHRRGPHGVAWWTERIEGWLAEDVDALRAPTPAGTPGRPLLVTENDYALRLYNGDTGVVVAAGDGQVARGLRPRRRGRRRCAPGRLEAVETVYAMTVHKSQGSQFGTAAVLLPPATSPILTRELLYTAVTRARERLRRRRARGVAARRGRAPDRARLGAAPPPLGRGPHGRRRKWIARVTGRKPSRW